MKTLAFRLFHNKIFSFILSIIIILFFINIGLFFYDSYNNSNTNGILDTLYADLLSIKLLINNQREEIKRYSLELINIDKQIEDKEIILQDTFRNNKDLIYNIDLNLQLLGINNSFSKDDVTIILSKKDQPFKLEFLKLFMQNVPKDVRTLCFLTIPLFDDKLKNEINEFKLEFDNLEIIYSNKHSHYFTERRRAFLYYNITTKYVIFSEFQVLITDGFIKSFVEYFKEAQLEEFKRFHNVTTKVLIPKLQGLGRNNINHFHSEFKELTAEKCGNGWNFETKFLNIDERPRIDQFTKFPKFDWDKRRLVDYIEDHLILFETEYYRDNLYLNTLKEGSFYYDFEYSGYVCLVNGITIQVYPHQLNFNYFQDKLLKDIYVLVEKWCEYNIFIGYEVYERMFNYKNEDKWRWPSTMVDNTYTGISESNIIKLEYYKPSDPYAMTKHSNLLISCFLSSSFYKFEIIENDKIVRSSMNGKELLDEIYNLQINNNLNYDSIYYLRCEQVYESRISEFNIPDYSKELLEYATILPTNEEKEPVHLQLRGDCLYHTESTNDELDSNKVKFFFKIQVNNEKDNKRYYDYFIWDRTDEENQYCENILNYENRIWYLVTSETKIPIPSHKQQVLMKEYHYRFFT